MFDKLFKKNEEGQSPQAADNKQKKPQENLVMKVPPFAKTEPLPKDHFSDSKHPIYVQGGLTNRGKYEAGEELINKLTEHNGNMSRQMTSWKGVDFGTVIKPLSDDLLTTLNEIDAAETKDWWKFWK